eukprot:2815344-Alexandrium_andersonii.AAC.1
MSASLVGSEMCIRDSCISSTVAAKRVNSSANNPTGTLLTLGKAAECCLPRRKPQPRARREAMRSLRA